MRTRFPLIFFAAVLACAQAHAEVLTVTNSLDDLANPPAGSLRKTVLDAQSGDSINFAPTVAGTITLGGGELLLDKNLTIQGPGAATLSISGDTKSRVFRVPSGVTATIGGLTIRDGKAQKGADATSVLPPGPGGSGGAVSNSGDLTITECVVTASVAGDGGKDDDSRYIGAGPGGNGGAIANTSGVLTLRKSTISGSKAGNATAYNSSIGGHGGGVSNVGGTMVLTDCTISQNIAGTGLVGGNGGGIYCGGGTTTIERCTVERNKAGFGVGLTAASPHPGGSGGGVAIATNAVVTVALSTITANVCGESEQGPLFQPGRFPTAGAGISSEGTVSIVSCTISGNAGWTTSTRSGTYASGAGINAAGALTLSNTIVAKNISGPGGHQDLNGSVTSGGHNLIGSYNPSYASGILPGNNGDKAGTPIAPLDPRLGSLATFGTSTAVLPLLPDSPAMDAGDDQLVGTDQRGMPRRIGTHVDIGAVEAEVVVEFAATTTVASEADGTIVLSLKRSGSISGPASVQYSLTGSTATEGADFIISGDASFAPGESQRTLSLSLINDAAAEPLETITLSLNDPSSGTTVGANQVHVVQLNDNDGTGKIAFATPTSSVIETSAKAIVSVIRTDGVSGQLSVAFQTTAGTAGASDFASASGTLTFAEGVTERTIEIPILNDGTIESVEDFTVTLSAISGGGAIGEPNVHTVTIEDDDAPAILSFASSNSTTEEAGTATVTVIRAGNTMYSASAGYVMVDGSATNQSDYTSSLGSVIFAPGVTQQTITVPIIEDSTLEGDETFQLKFSSLSSNAVFGPQTTHTVTITNDDQGRPAEVFTVTNSGDDPQSPAPGSLRQLIADAQYGDTIIFAPDVTGVITLGGAQIVVDKKLTIVGPGADTLALSGNQSSRIFEVKASGTLSINGVTLRDGRAATGMPGANGGAVLAAGNVTITNCKLTNNAAGNGSLIDVGGAGTSAAIGAGGSGGAISSSGSLTMTRCVITFNRAGDGAASHSTVVLITHHGGIGGNGGAISSSGNLTLTECSLTDNQSGNGGDAHKTAGSQTGRPGLGGLGGGVFVSGTFLIERCCIDTNRTGNTGAGWAAAAGEFGGGGIAVAATGSGELKTSTLSANTAGTSGFYNTTAGRAGSGGGIYSAGTLAVVSCTILKNTAGEFLLTPVTGQTPADNGKGGGIFSSGTTTVRNSIIAENLLAPSSESNLGRDVSGSFTTAGHNLVGTSTGSSGFTVGQNFDLIGAAPSASPLADNGGPTQTHALATFSAAVNAGDDTITGIDQCLNPRLVGAHVDIGAFELPTGSNPIIAFAVGSSQVAEAAGAVTIELTRGGELSAPTAIDFSVSAGSATAGSDYALTSGTVQFASHQTQAWLTIPITDDGAFENAETFTINLVSPSGNPSLGNRSAHTVTIFDNDIPVIQFDSATSTVNENAGTIEVTLLRAGDLSVTSSVSYTTINGTAIANGDYTPSNGSITFGPGVAQQKLILALMNDGVFETSEQFSIQLSAPFSADLGGTPTRVVTITDDDFSIVNFEVATTTVSEAAGHALVKIMRSGAAEGTASVSYQTTAGTAAGNDDFTPLSGALSFAPFVTEQTIAIPITNESVPENDETFTLTLSNSTGAALGSLTTHTVTILDEDSPSTIAFTNASANVDEASGEIPVSITRSGSTSQSVTVNLSANSGTASGGSDYLFGNSSITFPAGLAQQTVTILIVNDFIEESVETFTLTLSDPTGAALGSQTTHTITILDDAEDLPEVRKGSFRGLAESAGTGAVEFAGIIATTTDRGRLTGTLQIRGRTLRLSGKFSETGAFFQQFAWETPSGLILLDLHLQLESGGSILRGSVLVSDSTTFQVQAKRDVLGTPSDPVLDANTYTALLGTQLAGNPPGILRAGIKSSGRVSLSGMLPDGTRLVASSHLAEDRSFPMFIPLYAKKLGYLGGTAQFVTATQLPLTGELHWNKPANSFPPYAGGFNDESVALTGAVYTPPNRQRILDDFNSSNGVGAFQWSEGNSTSLGTGFSWSERNVIVPASPNPAQTRITLQTLTGLWSGSFRDSSGHLHKLYGICLQHPDAGADIASGFYLDGDSAGRLELVPQN